MHGPVTGAATGAGTRSVRTGYVPGYAPAQGAGYEIYYVPGCAMLWACRGPAMSRLCAVRLAPASVRLWAGYDPVRGAERAPGFSIGLKTFRLRTFDNFWTKH